jgi:Fe-S-cluster-containing hydrogenase component 2/CRP-like cAMP-binding protein
MAKQLMPPAQIEERPSDVLCSDELISKLSLFAQLKRKPTLDKFPGTLRIRRYKPGEVIVGQGDPGWTAFYILTMEDVLELRRSQLQLAPEGPQRQALGAKLTEFQQKLAQRKTKGSIAADVVATVHLTMARTVPIRKRRHPLLLLHRLFVKEHVQSSAPASIAIDGPTEIDAETMQATLGEGELFGEMSCMSGAPRSATIIARRDCYMLEMLRNILDQMQKDPAYRAYTDEVQKRRIIQLHLRKLSILGDLTDQQFASVQDRLELATYEAGQTIYDEFERSDSLYIIRTGLVKLIKKSSALIHGDHVRDFPGLLAALREGEGQPDTPRGKIWQLLPEAAQSACRNAAGMQVVAEALRQAILQALNGLIKDRQLPDTKEFQKVVSMPAFQECIQGLPEKRKEWSDQDVRRHNRHLLDALYDDIRGYRRRVGPDCVLFYCGHGEFIGETGSSQQVSRDHSCVACGQPQEGGKGKDSGHVELVRIPYATFTDIVKASPTVRQKIERKFAERKKQTQKRLKVPAWDGSHSALISKQFEQLGLIQGQQLMLIDLDRCTRCDECVRACVETHADGNSRLFLDGPRFGKYLVPTSCRSCLDPVCMIGCPVGSIHRGSNGQIVIEDWCIGCGLCADQCPYGSIQMHDIGIIPEDARVWRYLPADVVGTARWTARNFNDTRWERGTGPFLNDWEFRSRLGKYAEKQPRSRTLASIAASLDFRTKRPELVSSRVAQPMCFRYRFELTANLMRPDSQLKLELTSQGSTVSVWINGQEIQAADKPKQGKREYWMPPKTVRPAARVAGAPEPVPAAPPTPPRLYAGRNVLAVRVDPEVPSGQVVLKLRLDAIRKPTVAEEIAEEVTQKLVTNRAVVCDLCSTSLGQVPACVNACPHDAAMRVDARSGFPEQ